MNHKHIGSALLAWVALAALAGCGGGGNESGPAEEILASPSGVVAEGAPGACATGTGPTVYLYGGTPPYKLDNSAPAAMAIDKQVVTNSGDGFTITFRNGQCIEGIPVTVEDDMGRVLAIPVTNKKGVAS